ncbi:YfbU family protein [Xanthomonas arboricola]|uniref:YfbU family protein n=1 Tax=Xanthomonas arboricola TaxID=56448 RepID=UPI000CEEEC33|nr:YfbU family protein [Xanthomonas arboricola]PPT70104.1 hypothetical protein XarbCFBP8142_00270 [Xanthomonas arboricola]CAG2087975.1 YfbU family protein [Xanthomonas arboricola pv. juglandis]
MNDTDYLRLIAAMVADIHKQTVTDGDVNSKLVSAALWNQEDWAIRWEHNYLFPDAENPPHVKYVVSVLGMWTTIEDSYGLLSEAEQSKVAAEAKFNSGKKPEFHGFDGNEEAEYSSVARMLIEHLKRFETFKERYMNTHSPTTERYTRMLEVYKPINSARSNNPHNGLSAEELIEILNAPYKR